MSRRKAAAVPASKVELDTIYAVERDGELHRFRVDRVTTHRVSSHGNPHDYESEVTGRYVGSYSNEKATFKPDRLLGKFEEFAVLVAKKEKEEAERKAIEQQRKANATELRKLLYKFIGQEAPKNADQYEQPFRIASYSGTDVDVRLAAQPLLLAALREHFKKEPQLTPLAPGELEKIVSGE